MPTITQAQAGWLTVGVVVLVVLCGLALCLMTYAAMAIGQSFKKNKGLMSVVFFFVLWIGTRLVLALIFGAATLLYSHCRRRKEDEASS